MEIILLENIDNLGSRGEIVKVADGYARNYLLPQKQALAATPQNRKWLEQQRVRFMKVEAKERAGAEDVAKMMEGVSVTVTRKAGEQGTLFGSVTTHDIAEQLTSRGYKVDRRKIQLDHPLKVLGEYDVHVRLHREVVATVRVKVEPEGELEPAAEVAPPEPPEPSEPSEPPAPAEPAAE